MSDSIYMYVIIAIFKELQTWNKKINFHNYDLYLKIYCNYKYVIILELYLCDFKCLHIRFENEFRLYQMFWEHVSLCFIGNGTPEGVISRCFNAYELFSQNIFQIYFSKAFQ